MSCCAGGKIIPVLLSTIRVCWWAAAWKCSKLPGRCPTSASRGTTRSTGLCSPHISHVSLLKLRGLYGRLLCPLAVLLGLLSEQHVAIHSLAPLPLGVSIMSLLSRQFILARSHLDTILPSGVSSSQRQACGVRSPHWLHAPLLPALSAVPGILPMQPGRWWLTVRLQSLHWWLRGHPPASLRRRLGPGRWAAVAWGPWLDRGPASLLII